MASTLPMGEDLLYSDTELTGYQRYWTVPRDNERPLYGTRGRNSADSGKVKGESQERHTSQLTSSPSSLIDVWLVRRADYQDSHIVGVDVIQGCNQQKQTYLQNRGQYDKGAPPKHFPNDRLDNAEKLQDVMSRRRITCPTTLDDGDWSPGNNVGTSTYTSTAETTDEEFRKLSHVEFRRLKEQVRDVSVNLRNKFRTSAYQKLYHRANGENVNQVYRSQLAASLRAFQPKTWTPLNHQEIDPNFLRCRPVTPANDRQPISLRSRSATPTRPQRPKSVPVSAFRNRYPARRCETPSDVHPGKFDTLSPQVIQELMGRTERPELDNKSPLIEIIAAETEKLAASRDDEADNTSGIDSAGSDEESTDSEEESDFEPDVRSDLPLPELNLRPEKLDAIYIPEPKRGWRQFDFDMDTVDLPPYEFQSPFPDYLDDLDLRQIAKLKWNWRNHVKVKPGPKEDMLEGLLDRLVELEKLQMDTIDWENKRASTLKKTSLKRNTSSSKLKDKRCCSSCLQQLCFGDCPDKLVQSNSCDNCRQSFCTGTCKEVRYEQRMRQPRVEDERPPPPRSPHPKACSSCQKRHNAKYINANNLVLGQARLNNATFNRGQSSVKAKDLRPKSETTMPLEVLAEFERLGLDVVQPTRPSTAMPSSRPRSRNSLLPGKSFNSQRRDSLTDSEKLMLTSKKKRGRPIKLKRPKTAA